MDNRIIDTHVHIWDLNKASYPWLKGDTSIINRTYAIEELEGHRKEANVTEGILVQASGNFEDTELMLETAEKKEWIKGVVAWLPLMNPSATQSILEEKYLENKYIKGIRHQIHDEADTRWLLQDTVIESLKILAKHDISFDIVAVLPAHIQTALDVAEKVPELRMVFDHLSQPPIAKKEKFGKWGELMKAAAEHKNFYAKISGLGTTSGNHTGWTNDDLKPYIGFAIQNFGTDRCFCGGDWPVSLLAGSYTKIWNAYQDIINELTTEKERQKIFYTNAKQFYKL
jgi:L-fuconolactonase